MDRFIANVVDSPQFASVGARYVNTKNTLFAWDTAFWGFAVRSSTKLECKKVDWNESPTVFWACAVFCRKEGKSCVGFSPLIFHSLGLVVAATRLKVNFMTSWNALNESEILSHPCSHLPLAHISEFGPKHLVFKWLSLFIGVFRWISTNRLKQNENE